MAAKCHKLSDGFTWEFHVYGQRNARLIATPTQSQADRHRTKDAHRAMYANVYNELASVQPIVLRLKLLYFHRIVSCLRNYITGHLSSHTKRAVVKEESDK